MIIIKTFHTIIDPLVIENVKITSASNKHHQNGVEKLPFFWYIIISKFVYVAPCYVTNLMQSFLEKKYMCSRHFLWEEYGRTSTLF